MKIEEQWHGRGHPESPKTGGQIVGNGGWWLRLGGVWYPSPYRSQVEAMREFEKDEEAATREVIYGFTQ